MNTPVGTCVACGGPVTVPGAWLGVIPPVPTCERCGRQAANGYGPKMTMQENLGNVIKLHPRFSFLEMKIFAPSLQPTRSPANDHHPSYLELDV